MKVKLCKKNSNTSLSSQSVLARRGESAFACGMKDGVVTVCSVDSMDDSGITFFTERKFAPGEEVGVQINVGLGKGEFCARLFHGTIQDSRQIKDGYGRGTCRTQVGWAGATGISGAFL